MASTGFNSGGKKFLPVTAFNTAQFEPTSCVYELSVADFRAAVLEIAKTFIDEFDGCVYERGNNGHDALLLYLPANSHHLVDRKSIEGTVLTQATSHRSPEMKEFLARFCKRTNDSPEIKDSHYQYGTLLPLTFDSASTSRVSGIVVNPKAFMDLIFDVNGNAFRKANPDAKSVPQVKLEVECIYTNRPPERDGRPRLAGFSVKKTVRGRRGELHTKYAINI